MVNLNSFWSRIEKTDDCWNWKGGKTIAGYGLVYEQLRGGKRIRRYAHRIMWEIHNGSIPAKHYGCHHCDNPSCVNPEHLFCGTSKENHQDCIAKGRDNYGERNGQASLTEKQVLEMRQMRKQGLQYKEIARLFRVKEGTAYKAASGRNWRYLSEQLI